jgi:hypothetical protein
MFFQAVMERAARSRSLADLTDGTSGHDPDNARASGTATTHLSLLDLNGTSHQASNSILDAGSPAGSPRCSFECDPAVLDLDSDTPETENEDGINTDGDKMIIDKVMSD